MTRRAFAISVFLVGAVAASAGDLIPYHRRAKTSCGISPCFDYVPRKLSKADVADVDGRLKRYHS
jgi:hypothetical protein